MILTNPLPHVGQGVSKRAGTGPSADPAPTHTEYKAISFGEAKQMLHTATSMRDSEILTHLFNQMSLEGWSFTASIPDLPDSPVFVFCRTAKNS